MKVVGYTSVLEKKNGTSTLIRQEEAIRELCDVKGFHLYSLFHEDQQSEKGILPPQFCRMLYEMLLENVRTIVVEGLDSIAIDKYTLENIMVFLFSKKINLVVCSGFHDEFRLIMQKPIYRARIEMQREFSKFDRAFENVKRINARKKIRIEQGKCEGRKSYREVVPQTVNEIRRLRRKRFGLKRRTCREIAEILNNSGHLTMSGKKFTGNNVSVILHRFKSTGKGCYASNV